MSGLLRRRAMMGGEPLPYDAEVQWLQGDGSAYILTGLKGTGQTKIKMRAFDFFTSTFLSRWLFGEIASGSTARFGLYINGTSELVRFNYGSTYIDFQHYSIYPSDCTIEIGGGTAKVGSDSRSYTVGSFTSSISMIFPGVNNGGNAVANTAKFGAVHIESQGTVLDLIPVRVGTVGYMYDRNSGQLFSASGGGAFVVGPDV